MLYTTAATLRAILAFTDPLNTPKIAYDKDDLAIPLIEKIRDAVGGRDGSQSVTLWFDNDEDELKRQFNGICRNIQSIFSTLESYSA